MLQNSEKKSLNFLFFSSLKFHNVRRRKIIQQTVQNYTLIFLYSQLGAVRRCIVSRPGGALKGRFSWFPDGIPKVQRCTTSHVYFEHVCNMNMWFEEPVSRNFQSFGSSGPTGMPSNVLGREVFAALTLRSIAVSQVALRKPWLFIQGQKIRAREP